MHPARFQQEWIMCVNEFVRDQTLLRLRVGSGMVVNGIIQVIWTYKGLNGYFPSGPGFAARISPFTCR
jgi:hypothetical protein